MTDQEIKDAIHSAELRLLLGIDTLGDCIKILVDKLVQAGVLEYGTDVNKEVQGEQQ